MQLVYVNNLVCCFTCKVAKKKKSYLGKKTDVIIYVLYFVQILLPLNISRGEIKVLKVQKFNLKTKLTRVDNRKCCSTLNNRIQFMQETEAPTIQLKLDGNCRHIVH